MKWYHVRVILGPYNNIVVKLTHYAKYADLNHLTQSIGYL